MKAGDKTDTLANSFINGYRIKQAIWSILLIILSDKMI